VDIERFSSPEPDLSNQISTYLICTDNPLVYGALMSANYNTKYADLIFMHDSRYQIRPLMEKNLTFHTDVIWLVVF
jgi:hypothetical protein